MSNTGRIHYDFCRDTLLQGDMALVPVESFDPCRVTVETAERDLVLAHSETGHHHVVESDKATLYLDDNDPARGWMVVHEETVLEHRREEFQHEAQIVPAGAYLVQRQVAAGQRAMERAEERRVWTD